MADRRRRPVSSGSLNDTRAIRLHVIDHTGMLRHVRDRWNRLAAEPDINLSLLSPQWWRENYRSYRFEPDQNERFTSFTGRTFLTGDHMKSIYLTGLGESFRRSRPDVVLMMEESFTMFGLQIEKAARQYSPGIPLLFYNNNVVSYDLPGFRLAPLYRWIGRRVTPRCDLGLCVNRSALKVLEESGHGTPGVELFYGVDDQVFRPDHDGSDRADLLRRLGLAENSTVILCLGRQLRGKGYQDVVEAFAEVRKETGGTRLHLMIVGSGPYEEEIRSLAGARLERGSYTLNPTIPFEEVPTLVRAVDAHILPSHTELNEQFGRVNVEAMLSGTLAVASRSGGVSEVIGDGGIIFDPQDIGALKRIIRRIIDDPEELDLLRERGRQRALARFSVQRFVSGVARIVRLIAVGENPATIAATIAAER